MRWYLTEFEHVVKVFVFDFSDMNLVVFVHILHKYVQILFRSTCVAKSLSCICKPALL